VPYVSLLSRVLRQQWQFKFAILPPYRLLFYKYTKIDHVMSSLSCLIEGLDKSLQESIIPFMPYSQYLFYLRMSRYITAHGIGVFSLAENSSITTTMQNAQVQARVEGGYDIFLPAGAINSQVLKQELDSRFPGQYSVQVL
jgi:hypothetical protein